MTYYNLIKTTIDITRLTNVIINIVMRQYYMLEFIVSNKNIFFMFKFLLFVYYFLSIE